MQQIMDELFSKLPFLQQNIKEYLWHKGFKSIDYLAAIPSEKDDLVKMFSDCPNIDVLANQATLIHLSKAAKSQLEAKTQSASQTADDVNKSLNVEDNVNEDVDGKSPQNDESTNGNKSVILLPGGTKQTKSEFIKNQSVNELGTPHANQHDDTPIESANFLDEKAGNIHALSKKFLIGSLLNVRQGFTEVQESMGIQKRTELYKQTEKPILRLLTRKDLCTRTSRAQILGISPEQQLDLLLASQQQTALKSYAERFIFEFPQGSDCVGIYFRVITMIEMLKDYEVQSDYNFDMCTATHIVSRIEKGAEIIVVLVAHSADAQKIVEKAKQFIDFATNDGFDAPFIDECDRIKCEIFSSTHLVNWKLSFQEAARKIRTLYFKPNDSNEKLGIKIGLHSLLHVPVHHLLIQELVTALSDAWFYLLEKQTSLICAVKNIEETLSSVNVSKEVFAGVIEDPINTIFDDFSKKRDVLLKLIKEYRSSTHAFDISETLSFMRTLIDGFENKANACIQLLNYFNDSILTLRSAEVVAFDFAMLNEKAAIAIIINAAFLKSEIERITTLHDMCLTSETSYPQNPAIKILERSSSDILATFLAAKEENSGNDAIVFMFRIKKNRENGEPNLPVFLQRIYGNMKKAWIHIPPKVTSKNIQVLFESNGNYCIVIPRTEPEFDTTVTPSSPKLALAQYRMAWCPSSEIDKFSRLDKKQNGEAIPSYFKITIDDAHANHVFVMQTKLKYNLCPRIFWIDSKELLSKVAKASIIENELNIQSEGDKVRTERMISASNDQGTETGMVLYLTSDPNTALVLPDYSENGYKTRAAVSTSERKFSAIADNYLENGKLQSAEALERQKVSESKKEKLQKGPEQNMSHSNLQNEVIQDLKLHSITVSDREKEKINSSRYFQGINLRQAEDYDKTKEHDHIDRKSSLRERSIKHRKTPDEEISPEKYFFSVGDKQNHRENSIDKHDEDRNHQVQISDVEAYKEKEEITSFTDFQSSNSEQTKEYGKLNEYVSVNDETSKEEVDNNHGETSDEKMCPEGDFFSTENKHKYAENLTEEHRKERDDKMQLADSEACNEKEKTTSAETQGMNLGQTKEYENIKERDHLDHESSIQESTDKHKESPDIEKHNKIESLAAEEKQTCTNNLTKVQSEKSANMEQIPDSDANKEKEKTTLPTHSQGISSGQTEGYDKIKHHNHLDRQSPLKEPTNKHEEAPYEEICPKGELFSVDDGQNYTKKLREGYSEDRDHKEQMANSEAGNEKEKTTSFTEAHGMNSGKTGEYGNLKEKNLADHKSSREEADEQHRETADEKARHSEERSSIEEKQNHKKNSKEEHIEKSNSVEQNSNNEIYLEKEEITSLKNTEGLNSDQTDENDNIKENDHLHRESSPKQLDEEICSEKDSFSNKTKRKYAKNLAEEHSEECDSKETSDAKASDKANGIDYSKEAIIANIRANNLSEEKSEANETKSIDKYTESKGIESHIYGTEKGHKKKNESSENRDSSDKAEKHQAIKEPIAQITDLSADLFEADTNCHVSTSEQEKTNKENINFDGKNKQSTGGSSTAPEDNNALLHTDVQKIQDFELDEKGNRVELFTANHCKEYPSNEKQANEAMMAQTTPYEGTSKNEEYMRIQQTLEETFDAGALNKNPNDSNNATNVYHNSSAAQGEYIELTNILSPTILSNDNHQELESSTETLREENSNSDIEPKTPITHETNGINELDEKSISSLNSPSEEKFVDPTLPNQDFSAHRSQASHVDLKEANSNNNNPMRLKNQTMKHDYQQNKDNQRLISTDLCADTSAKNLMQYNVCSNDDIKGKSANPVDFQSNIKNSHSKLKDCTELQRGSATLTAAMNSKAKPVLDKEVTTGTIKQPVRDYKKLAKKTETEATGGGVMKNFKKAFGTALKGVYDISSIINTTDEDIAVPEKPISTTYYQVERIKQQDEEKNVHDLKKQESRLVQRLAERYLEYAKQIKDSHFWQMNDVLDNKKPGVNYFSIGIPSAYETGREKVLLIVGGTGHGKSTLIDSMANYLYEVKFSDKFRFKVVRSTTKAKEYKIDAGKSQTTIVTSYKFCDTRLGYTLTVVDTPGFGDTEGPARDVLTRKCIQKWYETERILPDAVCIVIRSSETRLKPQVINELNSVIDLLKLNQNAKVMQLLTFCDPGKPPVVEALKELMIPVSADFKFNSSAIFENPYSSDEDNKRLCELLWNKGMKNFSLLFDAVTQLESQSGNSLLSSFNINFNEIRLENRIHCLWTQINRVLALSNQIQQTKTHKQKIDHSYNHKLWAIVSKDVKCKLPGDEHSLICNECKMTCHLKCRRRKDNDMKWCSVMKHVIPPTADQLEKERGNNVFGPHAYQRTSDQETAQLQATCTVCPKRCLWKKHSLIRYVLESEVCHKYWGVRQYAKLYNIAVEKLDAESLLQALSKAYETEYLQLANMINENCELRQHLDTLTMSSTKVTLTQYIEQLLAAKNNEMKPEYFNMRRVIIEDLLEMAKTARDDQMAFKLAVSEQYKTIIKEKIN